jgi:hypothetical protein
MKKIKLLTWILLVVLLGGITTACKKETVSDSVKNELNAELQSIPNPSVQRVAYQTLTSSEMLLVWQNHLTWAKNSLTLTTSQISKIDELLGLLSVSFFEQSGTSDAFEIWKATTTEVFRPKQIYLLFQQPLSFDLNIFISSEKLQEAVDGGGGGSGTTSCHCSQATSFCNLLLEPGGNGMFTCDKKECRNSVKGCGWLWQQECNGICQYHYFFNSGGGVTSSTNN